jgi:DNA-binding response OmpR family regulator
MARIVIVEDDTPLRVALVRFLTNHGHAITAESSAEDARLAVERVQPDLLIAAVHLPGLDGEAFAKAIHARGMTLPVIIMISQSFQHDSRAGSPEPLIWRISKPFSAPTLLQAVQAALEGQSQREVAD